MCSQDARLSFRIDIFVQCLFHGNGLLYPGSDKQNRFRFHDAAYSHTDRPVRNLVLAVEKALIVADGAGGQLHHMTPVDKLIIRFVEPDMTITPNAQQLQINAASLLNCAVVLPAFGRNIRCATVGNMSVGRDDINMLEQLLLHKVIVTTVMCLGNSAIFIQIKCDYRREIQDAFAVQPC